MARFTDRELDVMAVLWERGDATVASNTMKSGRQAKQCIASHRRVAPLPKHRHHVKLPIREPRHFLFLLPDSTAACGAAADLLPI